MLKWSCVCEGLSLLLGNPLLIRLPQHSNWNFCSFRWAHLFQDFQEACWVTHHAWMRVGARLGRWVEDLGWGTLSGLGVHLGWGGPSPCKPHVSKFGVILYRLTPEGRLASAVSCYDSLIHWFIPSVVDGPWILSCPFIGISTTICSFVGTSTLRCFYISSIVILCFSKPPPRSGPGTTGKNIYGWYLSSRILGLRQNLMVCPQG